MIADGKQLTAFLQEVLPGLHLRPAAFRRVRRQVWRRVAARLRDLGLADLEAYRRWIEAHPEERAVLDRSCWITVSRLGRDREVWTRLVGEVLPALGRGRPVVEAWSAGCANGEEPYTLAIGWAAEIAPVRPEVALDVLATDVDAAQLSRARVGCYAPGTLRELPEVWRRAGFESQGARWCVRDAVRERVRFAQHDLRDPAPAGCFDLVLCRNLAFSYFDEPLQRAVAATLRGALRDGGWLVVGVGEVVPDGAPGLVSRGGCFYQAVAHGASTPGSSTAS